uniref:Uncharacterized protein n=1 Tax=Medicago truncatula TaxID=3880 RepID=Q2HU77_MEDTR|nr:hypothetical protein MtrDRAFT_AC149208g23v2 [Medicago truncatula]
MSPPIPLFVQVHRLLEAKVHRLLEAKVPIGSGSNCHP